jgi:hypothetical protein
LGFKTILDRSISIQRKSKVEKILAGFFFQKTEKFQCKTQSILGDNKPIELWGNKV